jgi:hypothetical protein
VANGRLFLDHAFVAQAWHAAGDGFTHGVVVTQNQVSADKIGMTFIDNQIVCGGRSAFFLNGVKHHDTASGVQTHSRFKGSGFDPALS